METCPLGEFRGVRIPTAKGHFFRVTFGGGVCMSRNPSKLYSHHVDNLRELELALNHIARLSRVAIASRDPQRSLQSLLRLYAFLLGAWAECRLLKLLHEEFGFISAERDGILAHDTQLSQWEATVELAFRKHHKLWKAELNDRTLGVTSNAPRKAIVEVLTDQVRAIIEIRNKLAHGQWKYPLTNDGTKVETEKYTAINKENLLSLQFKYKMLGHLADAVHDLVVSPKTFSRDFDEHFGRLQQAQINLARRSYASYEADLIRRRNNARESAKTRQSRFPE